MFKRQFATKASLVKSISSLNWSSLSSLGSVTDTPKPKYIDLRDILERTDSAPGEYEAAQVKNREMYDEYRKLKALDIKETKAEDLPLLEPFKEEWVLPQLMAFFGTGQCKPILSAEGQVDILATLRRITDKAFAGTLVFDNGTKVSSNAVVGMIKFMKVHPRGSIMPRKVTQGSPKGHRFSACVPLLFSAWKTYQNVPYSSYDYYNPSMEHVLEDDLINMLQYQGQEHPWSPEELAKLRDQAMYIKSTGGMRTPATTYMVYSTGDSDFDALPKLVKLCLLQLWVFQPSLYSPYAIHNLMDLDAPASEIIDTNVFITNEVANKPAAKSTENKLASEGQIPWN
jgi:hypothetical protein